MIELRVTAAEAGERLDRFVARQPRVGTRSAAERLIAAGAVSVDGGAVAKAHRLVVGEQVRIVTQPEAGEVAVELPEIPVLYADERLLVVEKPAGLLTHAVPGSHGPTLADALASRAGGGEPGRTGIVHRLDRNTSGLLVVARDAETLGKLQGQLRRHDIARTYTALVRGRPPSRAGRIEAPIGRDRHDRARISLDTDVPREAATRFELIEALAGRSLLRVELETGRTHQIRVHLQAIGHPVVGDPTYGHGAELGLERQFLHAGELAFVHPWTDQPVHVLSPLPDDLEAALERARAAADQPG